MREAQRIVILIDRRQGVETVIQDCRKQFDLIRRRGARWVVVSPSPTACHFLTVERHLLLQQQQGCSPVRIEHQFMARQEDHDVHLGIRKFDVGFQPKLIR